MRARTMQARVCEFTIGGPNVGNCLEVRLIELPNRKEDLEPNETTILIEAVEHYAFLGGDGESGPMLDWNSRPVTMAVDEFDSDQWALARRLLDGAELADADAMRFLERAKAYGRYCDEQSRESAEAGGS